MKFAAKLVTVTGAVLLAAALALLPAHSALATGQGCAISVNLQTCSYVNGTGLHINYQRGTATNLAGGAQRYIHIQLSGPRGTIKNCPEVGSLGTGQSATCTWSPNANEPAGNYCADTWQRNPSTGKYTNRGHACINVHS